MGRPSQRYHSNHLIGEKFGRLLIISDLGTKEFKGHKRRLVYCLCDCGFTLVTLFTGVRSGHTTSCGCYIKEKMKINSFKIKHGESKIQTLTYKSWRNLNSRIGKHKDYLDVTIDPRWSEYKNFVADMGERPSSKHSLDKDIRIPNNRHYSKETCMWATQRQQMNSTRRNIKISIKGKEIPLQYVLDILKPDIAISCLGRRLREGIPFLKAIQKEVRC